MMFLVVFLKNTFFISKMFFIFELENQQIRRRPRL